MYRYNFVLWNCQWIAKENLSHGTQSKERKLLSTDLVNNRFLNYEQGGVVGDLWRHSKWRTSYILRNLFKDANKESKHFSSALKDENFMIKYIFWYKIFLIKKTNKQRDRQTKQETWDVSITQPGAYLCMFVRPNGVHILFYNDTRMIPVYSGTFGYIQMNPWSIHLCLLFKKNDKWEYFICNVFLTPTPLT